MAPVGSIWCLSRVKTSEGWRARHRGGREGERGWGRGPWRGLGGSRGLGRSLHGNRRWRKGIGGLASAACSCRVLKEVLHEQNQSAALCLEGGGSLFRLGKSMLEGHDGLLPALDFRKSGGLGHGVSSHQLKNRHLADNACGAARSQEAGKANEYTNQTRMERRPFRTWRLRLACERGWRLERMRRAPHAPGNSGAAGINNKGPRRVELPNRSPPGLFFFEPH
jgi:hypothetical protein